MDEKQLNIGSAIEKLGYAIASSQEHSVKSKVSGAVSDLQEYLNSLTKQENLTEKECEISQGIHTFFRKGMDSPLATMLWKMINIDFGVNIWYSFVRKVADAINKGQPEKQYYNIMRDIDKIYNESPTNENLFMLCALQSLTKEDFVYLLEFINQ